MSEALKTVKSGGKWIFKNNSIFKSLNFEHWGFFQSDFLV
jgi:hypothetical protein